jgi:hypothetical protein
MLNLSAKAGVAAFDGCFRLPIGVALWREYGRDRVTIGKKA